MNLRETKIPGIERAPDGVLVGMFWWVGYLLFATLMALAMLVLGGVGEAAFDLLVMAVLFGALATQSARVTVPRPTLPVEVMNLVISLEQQQWRYILALPQWFVYPALAYAAGESLMVIANVIW